MGSPKTTLTAAPKAALTPTALAFIPLGIAMNLAIGTVIHLLKVPLYLDAVGTILVTLLLGVRAGIITGVGSFLLGGILTNPVLPWFSLTQAAIAIYTYYVARRDGFITHFRTALSGLGLGVVAAVVSAPVIVALFGGVTGSGPSVIVAFLLSAGHSLIKAVFLSGIACEPIDKMLQCLLAVWILRGIPVRLLSKFVKPEAIARFRRA